MGKYNDVKAFSSYISFWRTLAPGFGLLVIALVCLVQQGEVRAASREVSGKPFLTSVAHASTEVPEEARVQILETYGKVPLSFEANRGQTDAQVKFLSRGSGYILFLTPTEAVLALRSQPSSVSGQESQTVLRMKLVDANPAPKVVGLDKLPGKVNYFIGGDPKQRQTTTSIYAKVKYEDVYPDINLVYYGNQQQLKYDFVVAPGADPSNIMLAFKGADKIEIDDRGDLVLHTAGGQFHQR
jgi:hypothetical protein